MSRLRPHIVLVACLVALSGCKRASAPIPGGDAAQGRAVIASAGCGACHAIPGIANAAGLVGPPLGNIGDRLMLAGVLSNTPDHMVAWLRDPQRIAPGNAMPDLGLSEQAARNATAYLYTLHGSD